ncbi:MAG: hypothetical protein VCA36_09620, partial [Opitutales bacterium]
TAKHATAIAGGGLPNAVRGPVKSMFTSHDFALKIASKPLVAALMDEGMPPAFGQVLGSLDSLVVTGDSAADSGSISLKLIFNDKRKNSLPALLDLGFQFFNEMSFGQGKDLPGGLDDPAVEVEEAERDPF